uniref:peptidoglycan DD-metalloendopeptidase family protein n=1 Tax=Enterobacter hormaechei TaxID=158836 RepID=UPI003CC56F9B
PVLSVGDGEVVVAKRSGAAGYYVAVRHGRTYTTRYMHLRKLLVNPDFIVQVRACRTPGIARRRASLAA